MFRIFIQDDLNVCLNFQVTVPIPSNSMDLTQHWNDQARLIRDSCSVYIRINLAV